MAFGLVELLPNTCWQEYKNLFFTSSGTTANNEQSVINTVGGPRYLDADGSSSDRYTMTSGTAPSQPIDRVVITRMDRYAGESVDLNFYTTYSSVVETSSYGTFAETLIGQNATDWVYSTVATDLSSVSEDGEPITCDGFSLDISNLDKLNKVYVSESIRFERIVPGSFSYFPTPRTTRVKPLNGGVHYYLTEQISFTFHQVPYSTLKQIEETPILLEDSFFVYDRGGVFLSEKLAHCVLLARPEIYEYNGAYGVGLSLGRIKEYV